MSDLQNASRVARFYTSARRIPILLGKWPNGGRIPGGPYRIVQLVVGSLVFVIGWNTRWLWGGSQIPLAQLFTLVLVTAAATWLSGRIPSTKRKLPNLLMDSMTALTAPGHGTYRGRIFRLAPPHVAGGAVLLGDGLLEHPADDIESSVEAHEPAAESGPSSVVHSAAPVLVAAADPADAPSPSSEATEGLPDNVIPLVPRSSYGTGLERLLDQARRKENS
ncbi:hypothetical protein ACR8AM_10950 [Clavibacter sepedonicus]|uniref:Membrane protein n=1 Tax=Clavibacter sepedonicus TaxID=31964 RepID=B0RJE0_CLASE|nr:hypothetical protein B5P19_15540 [Clavibacter sepedonicus]OQJ50960.1 hypothetical protein B5P20_16175 [Clavibacter sepedonicus]CAQ03330.1 putative membrane protein [Clavibacter sepedonicus]